MKVSLKNMFSKSENKSENLSFITKEIYDNIEECNCGGPVFKYHDVSKNIFIVKCGYHKKILDIDKLTGIINHAIDSIELKGPSDGEHPNPFLKFKLTDDFIKTIIANVETNQPVSVTSTTIPP